METADAQRGFHGEIRGTLRYVRTPNVARLLEFKVVALGEHWGEGDFNPGSRPGKNPLRIAFDLATDPRAWSLPPQGAKLGRRLLGRGRGVSAPAG
ncbi:MAG: hypothetical protein R3F11_16605 [Verrucomicrobiales bacterium]